MTIPSRPVEQQQPHRSHPRPLACQRGNHTWTATFRPTEKLCMLCGLVTYCPACFDEQHLLPAKRGMPFECSKHQEHLYRQTTPTAQEGQAR